jgi:hypothetical protein
MRLILEYGAACWDPYRKGQINALDRVQNMAAKFAYHRNYSNWICALFKAYTGERAWKAIVIDYKDHDISAGSIAIGKLGAESKRHIGKYSFVNRTIQQAISGKGLGK